MASMFSNSRVQLVVGGIIVLAAGVLAVTKYQLPSRQLNIPSSNSNQSTMGPITNASLPFASVTETDVTGKQIRIKTNRGDIVFKLDPVAAPLAAKNFYSLAQKGFYDGLTWHRVVADFVIQGGDPQGTGMGGPGYKFPDDPVNKTYVEGTVAMANSGPDTNGSQFFICKGTLCQTLQPNYSIFGQVTEGMDVVKTIIEGDQMIKVTIEPAA